MTKLVSNLFLEVKEGAAVEVDLGVSLAGELILSSFFLSFFLLCRQKKRRVFLLFPSLSPTTKKKREKRRRGEERESEKTEWADKEEWLPSLTLFKWTHYYYYYVLLLLPCPYTQGGRHPELVFLRDLSKGLLKLNFDTHGTF